MNAEVKVTQQARLAGEEGDGSKGLRGLLLPTGRTELVLFHLVEAGRRDRAAEGIQFPAGSRTEMA